MKNIAQQAYEVCLAIEECGASEKLTSANLKAYALYRAVQTIRALIANDAYAITFQTMGQYRTALLKAIDGVTAPSASPEQHPDDVAVDMFAKAMKGKLAQARAKGRSGWQTCNKYELSNMLRDHVEKGDPRDVANFCMFLHALGHPIQIAPGASPWASINPAATLADRLDELPEINFSNYTQDDVEALQAWAFEAYGMLAATLAEKKCTRCEYIGHCDCEVTERK